MLLSFHVSRLLEQWSLKNGFCSSSFVTKQELKVGKKRRTSTRRRNLENNTRNFVLMIARNGMSRGACEKIYKIILGYVMKTAVGECEGFLCTNLAAELMFVTLDRVESFIQATSQASQSTQNLLNTRRNAKSFFSR
jgi:hypothetical protein